jgi:hypothetical protein
MAWNFYCVVVVVMLGVVLSSNVLLLVFEKTNEVVACHQITKANARNENPDARRAFFRFFSE